MGFACPVCETPQQDAMHLANHLAFTAMTHGDEHEAWLDEHVPEWSEYGETELAEAAADLAPEADYEQVFEDTVHRHGGGTDGHRHGHTSNAAEQHSGIDPEAAAATGGETLDEEARAVLEEARGLTAEMLEDSADGEDTEDERNADESAED